MMKSLPANLNLRKAWGLDRPKATSGSHEITVAVIDTGADADDGGHPDIQDSIVGGESFTGTPWYQDNHGQGTHVAGVIAGKAEYSNHGAPSVELMPMSIYGEGAESYPRLSGTDFATPAVAAKAAMLLAQDSSLSPEEVKVALIGTGVDASHPNIEDRLASVKSFLETPADQDNHGQGTHVAGIIAGNKAGIEIEAPGAKILSMSNPGERNEPTYLTLSGTGSATPLVAGRVAMIREQNPNLSGKEVKAKLLELARSESAEGHTNMVWSLDEKKWVPDQPAANQSSKTIPLLGNIPTWVDL